jgi:hypothetical protein
MRLSCVRGEATPNLVGNHDATREASGASSFKPSQGNGWRWWTDGDEHVPAIKDSALCRIRFVPRFTNLLYWTGDGTFSFLVSSDHVANYGAKAKFPKSVVDSIL